MLKQKEVDKLKEWLQNRFSLENADLQNFDYMNHIDNNLTLSENKEILREKLSQMFRELPTKAEVKNELEKAEFEQLQEFKKQEEQAQLEFEKCLDKIKSTTTTEQLEKEYFMPKQYVKMVANGYARGFLLWGEAGLGKSFLVRKSFKEENKPFVVLKGHISPLALYEFLCDNRKENIILDDVNVLDNETNLNMFKACLNDEERIVQYHSKSNKLKLPNKFLFEGTITLLQNSSPKKSESLKAVESRILHHHLIFDYETKIKILYEIAKLPYYDLTEQEREEIVGWIKENTTKATENLNLRLLFMVYDFYRFNKTIWRELAKGIMQTDRIIELIVMGFPEKEWIKETGLSRRSYYDYKKKCRSADNLTYQNS